MRYMGWSYADLLTCPAAYVDVISTMALEEAAERERSRQ